MTETAGGFRSDEPSALLDVGLLLFSHEGEVIGQLSRGTVDRRFIEKKVFVIFS